MLHSVGIREAGTRGRGVFVGTSPVPAGVAVLEETPYACVLYDDSMALRCDWCLEPSSSLLRCSKSLIARYCSREHQRAAWSAGYREECAALVACAPRVPPSTVRLAARALWRRAREQRRGTGARELAVSNSKASPSELTSTYDQDVVTLLNHWSSLSDSRKTEFAQMAVLLRHFMTGEAGESTAQGPDLLQAEGMPRPDSRSTSQGPTTGSSSNSSSVVATGADSKAGTTSANDLLPSIREMALLLASFACNNHSICDEELRPIGVGLYPRGSMVNHDCQPNCMQSFTSHGRIMFRSLRTLSPGEEINISYVELAGTRQERRQMLLDTYHWDIDQVAADTTTTAAATAAETAAVAAVGVISEVSSSKTHLRWHGPMSHPPWQWDPRDSVLTQVVTHAAHAPSASVRAKQVQMVEVAGGLTARVVQEASAADPADMSFDTDFVDNEDEPQDSNQELAENIHAGISSGSSHSTSNSSSRIQHSNDDPQREHSLQLASPAGVPVVAANQQAHVKATPPEIISSAEFNVHVDCWGLTGLGECDYVAGTGFPVGVRELTERVASGLALQRRGAEAVLEGKQSEAVQFFNRALMQFDVPDDNGSNSSSASSSGSSSSGSRADSSSLGLGRCHILRIRLCAALLKALIEEAKDWQAALMIARELSVTYGMAYPPIWPNLGLHLLAQAKLEMLQGHPRHAAAAAQHALQILQLTNGGSSFKSGSESVVAEGRRVLWEAQAELGGQ